MIQGRELGGGDLALIRTLPTEPSEWGPTRRRRRIRVETYDGRRFGLTNARGFLPGKFARGAPEKNPSLSVGVKGGLGFFGHGQKSILGRGALMQQGRQECRPSDGPATLLSPMVATKACFAPPPPTLP